LQCAFSCEDETRENAYLPHNLTQNAIIYSGTHDNDTTQGWYKTSEDCDLDIVRRYMNISGENIAWDFIRLAYSTVCDIAIVPLQDVMKLGSEARMNTPGVPAGNWQWRYTTQMLKDEYAEGLSYLADLFGR
jgi:4-alpha-glucanotransferase